VLVPFSFALLAGCGGDGGAKPAASPAPVAAAPAPAAVDLSPVAAPSDLIAVGRFAKPLTFVGTVLGWASTQMPGLPAPGPRELSQAIAGEDVGEVIDASKPVDFVLVAGRGGGITPSLVVSASVKSVDAARAALSRYTLKAIDNGAFRVDGLGAATGDEDDLRTCILAPAAGPSPARLVCSDDRAAAERLAPYLTRTVARADYPSDVHVEMSAAPFRPMVERLRRNLPALTLALLSGRGAGEGMGEVATVLANELGDFALDAEGVTLDIVATEPAADVELTFGFRSKKSTIASWMTRAPDQVGPAPEVFFRLPVDASSATFRSALGPNVLDRVKGLTRRVIAEVLEPRGVSEADRKPLLDAVEKLITPSASASASGFDPEAVRKHLGGKDAKGRETPANLRAALAAASGWTVMAVEEPPQGVAATFKELSTALSAPALARALRDGATGPSLVSMKAVPVPKGANLPKESAHYEFVAPAWAELFLGGRLGSGSAADAKGGGAAGAGAKPAAGTAGKTAAKKGPEPKPIATHLYIVPDAATPARTWVAYGADEATLLSKLRGVLPGAPPAGTLASRSGLDVLRSGSMNAGGMLTATAVVAGVFRSEAETKSDVRPLERMLRMLEGGKAGVDAPVPFLATARAPQGAFGAGAMTAKLHVPRAAVEEAIRIGVGAAR
jgi:hypothetical protein